MSRTAALRAHLPAALREREFRLLYTGQTVSLIGDGMATVAIAFAVLDLTGSVTDLGLVLAAARGPLLLTVLAGGVVADRLPRRAIMIAADLIRVIAIAVAATLLIAGRVHLWELVVLQVFYGAAAGFFYPASTGLVPLTVPPALLQSANALRGLAHSAGAIVGPAIGGALVAATSPGWALAGDAASFGVSAGTLALLRLPPHVRSAPKRFLGDFVEGWHEFRSRTWVWLMIVVAGSFGNIFTAGFTALGPAIARAQLGGAGAWAAILAAQGVGGILGGLLVLKLRFDRPLVAANLGWALLVIPNLLLAFVAPVPVIAAGVLVGGLGMAIGQSLWDTSIQRHVPAAALSRVASYDWFGSLIFNPVGLALVGPISGAIGVRDTLIIAACWFGASSLTLACLPSIRAVRND